MTIPKIDSHIHFGGSIPVQFVWSAIQKQKQFHLAKSLRDVADAMTFDDLELPGFYVFLDKFKILDEIAWTEELLADSIKAVTELLDESCTDYALMRFSVLKYVRHMKLPIRDIVKFFYQQFESNSPGRVGLVLSLKYESNRDEQRQLADLLDDIQEYVVGIDLVGDEAEYDCDFYRSILRPWQRANKLVYAHVGESQSARNIMTAVQKIGIVDICHGLSIVDDPKESKEMLAICKDNNVCFHMAVTSNYLTGVCSNRYWHPIVDIVRSGNWVTIGTDDPVVCGKPDRPLTLDDEYSRLTSLGLAHSEISGIKAAAAFRSSKARFG